MNELEHYGTKGQKWGIRRFQYEDGSLTPEGKARYRKGFERDFDRRLNQSIRRTEKGKLEWDASKVIKNVNQMMEGKADGEKIAADYARRLERNARWYAGNMIPTAIMASGVRSQKDIMKKYGSVLIAEASLTPSAYKCLWELENIGNEIARNDHDKQINNSIVGKAINETTYMDLSNYAYKLKMSPEETGRVLSTMSSLDKQLKNVFDTTRKEYLDKKGPSVAKLPTPSQH